MSEDEETRLLVSNIDEVPEGVVPPRAFMSFVNACEDSTGRKFVRYGYSRAISRLTERSLRKDWHFWGAYSNPSMLNGWRFSAIYRVAEDGSQKVWDCAIWHKTLKVFVAGCTITDVRRLVDIGGNVGVQFVHNIVQEREDKKKNGARASKRPRMGAA